ncbi:MAG: hypothetical protein ABFD89_09060 [Bryobacteraceae bacterium]
MKHLTSLILLLVCAAGLFAQTVVTQPEARTVTIAAGGSVSTVASLAGCTVAGILMPTTAQEWTAANVGIQATIDGTNYYDTWDRYGAKNGIVAAANRWIDLQPSDTWGYFAIKLTSIDSSGNAVAQTAARTLKVICRK